MRRMQPYHHKSKYCKSNQFRTHRVSTATRRARAFNDNQGYQQGYVQGYLSGQNNTSCPSAVEYIGNVFLLGLTTLVGELVDLQAANALNVLLQPFQSENDGGVQQEILAGDVQDNDIIDLLDGLL